MLGIRQKPEHVRHGLVAQVPPLRVLVEDLLHGLHRAVVSELSEKRAELARDVIRWLVVVRVDVKPEEDEAFFHLAPHDDGQQVSHIAVP